MYVLRLYACNDQEGKGRPKKVKIDWRARCFGKDATSSDKQFQCLTTLRTSSDGS